MVGIAVGIDYHTLGDITSTGAEMRKRQDDQVGGTDSHDSAQAWLTYGQNLRIMDGSTFDDAIQDLRDGRCLQLDVWHATAQGPCLSGSGAYGHDMAVAPEFNNGKWLTCDPWCSPAKWIWWDEDLLRAGAEKLGSQSYTAAVAGPMGHTINRANIARLMRRASRDIMTRFTPDRPAIDEPRDTGGAGGRILYTTTKVPGEEIEAEDVMFNVAPITTHRDAIVADGAVLYRDSQLTERYSISDGDTPMGFVGSTDIAHIVVNAGNTNYVDRGDVLDIVTNDRSFT
jgi:hypothetical protein